MKQLLNDMLTGKPKLEEVPSSTPAAHHVLVRSRYSLVSVGTERAMLEYARSSLLSKASQNPKRVKQVVERIRAQGLGKAIRDVKGSLKEPRTLGYSNVGEVVASGPGLEGLHVGQRVVSNGPHAEFVSVPGNLCAAIPDEVSDEDAVFTVLGSIALEGIRLVAPTFGETVAVIGLGVIGLLAVQLLKASGCRVLAFDIDPSRLELAREFGALTWDAGDVDTADAALRATGGIGVDAVLIAASAKGNDVIASSARMCRKRGRIVLVGVVGLELDRSRFYQKELSFQVSCSYGPGRYDLEYEEKGRDYPLSYVRWTAKRNFEAVLEAMKTGALRTAPLVERRVPFGEAATAYPGILESGTLGVLFEYQNQQPPGFSIRVHPKEVSPSPPGFLKIGVIGAGQFARSTLLPALREADATISWIADLDGARAASAARAFGVAQATTKHEEVLADPEVGAVFILVRHDQHASLVRAGLEAGKHVFVEKPLALGVEELTGLLEAYEQAGDRMLMVGFNRRFSPHLLKCYELLQGRSEPLAMTMTVNAGEIPAGMWVQDPEVGGGRIVGEACHFIDLMTFLAGAGVHTVAAMSQRAASTLPADKVSIILSFNDGSVGTVNYFANGPKEYPKETLEIFCEGKALRVEDFRTTRGWGWPSFRRLKAGGQNKGHAEQCRWFLKALAVGGSPPISLGDLVGATLASFAAVRSATEGRLIRLREDYPAFRAFLGNRL